MFFFLPDWAPNVHPLLVHFPIALLFSAVLVDVSGLLFFRERTFWRNMAVLLYGLGGLAIVATYFAGRQAADLVFLSQEADPVLSEHADLGLWSLWFFGSYAALRPLVDLTAIGKRTAVRVVAVLIAVGGLFLLYETAEHGAELVFHYGVGVDAVDHSVKGVAAPQDSTAAALSAPSVQDNGGWTWKPTRAAAWKSSMSFPEGTADFTRTAMLDGGDHGDVLALTTDGEPTMFYFDQLLADLQMDVAVNLDNFDGVIMFVHSVMNADNYHFTAVGNGQMRIGRSENGDLYMLDTKDFTPTGWLTYRVVASEDHFRSYADEALVTHGHGPAARPGPAGIRLNGKGTVLLDFMSVQPLGAEAPADEHDGDAAGQQDPS